MSLLIKEWKALVTNKKVLIPVIAVLFIPVLYAGMFLWAFWDPYENLEQLPVAVVNQDRGAEFEGENLHVGKELVDNLRDNPQFKWVFVDQATADKGLKDQKYYMKIEIPENFSANATTLLDDQPKELEMKYVPNEGFNFLSAQIGNTAVEKIKEEVAAEVTKTYAEGIFDNIGKVADGLGEASEGASEINSGTGKLKDGSVKLKDNLTKLAESSIKFKEGVQTASKGTQDLQSGISSLDTGLGKLQQGYTGLEGGINDLAAGNSQLAAGSEKLNSGTQELNQKIPQLTDGAKQVSEGTALFDQKFAQFDAGQQEAKRGAEQLAGGIDQLQAKMKELEPVLAALPPEKRAELMAAFEQLNQGSDKLSAGVGELAANSTLIAGQTDKLAQGAAAVYKGQQGVQAGVGELSKGQEALNAGIQKAAAGSAQLSQGAEKFGTGLNDAKTGSAALASGSSKLTSGVGVLASKSGELQEGAGKLADGASELDKGVGTLSGGTSELSSALADAADKTKESKGSEPLYDMMAKPVGVQNEKINEVPNYGTGFTPYFLSLGLFVGALLISIVFPLKQSAGEPKSALSWFFSKFGILLAVGIIQSLVADAVLLLGLGIEVQSVGLFMLFSILTSLTFLALIQFFVTSLGDPGRFVAIIILILQLTTSAGTFPLELIPEPLQIFNYWLPMTYSVAGFKAVISSGDFSYLWSQSAILLGMMLLMMVCTIVYMYFNVRKNRKLTAAEEV
ncbi:YhgE/Pip domain-containing protein [Bacillus sp. FJAT-42376]|uniref:YhgE/Pip domain-containing protein n=1 Tax=Bacillus sp. FJAT-42376 TaxID=2014076 RepID=UPI000F4FEA24|nr:YhgE/Pip domain-containing protein [Bacillus sp. FJAT-42376]AZB42254.1 YhgE/Pip domain-containing protein [Bacillus sp. FJAT-42376]